MKTAVLANVPFGTIIRYQGRWGVVSRIRDGQHNGHHKRVVHFWWERFPEYVPSNAKVQVAPASSSPWKRT